jgi:general secretion pathway protein G
MGKPVHAIVKVPAARKARGFTLLELLVVMAVMGLLVGYAALKLFSGIHTAEVKEVPVRPDTRITARDRLGPDGGHHAAMERGPAFHGTEVEPAG